MSKFNNFLNFLAIIKNPKKFKGEKMKTKISFVACALLLATGGGGFKC